MKRNPDSQPSVCPVHIAIRHPAVRHGMPICHDAHGKLMSAKDGIRAIRRWLSWKVESVAECCGVSVGTVRLWEHKGKQGLPVPAYALIALMLAVEQEESERIATRQPGVCGETEEPLPPLGKGRYKAIARSKGPLDLANDAAILAKWGPFEETPDKAKSEPHEKKD